MGLVSVWENAKGAANAAVTIDPLGKQATTFARQDQWCVLLDSIVEPWEVIGATGLPTISTKPNSDGYICIGHQPTRDANNPMLHNVIVTYVKNVRPTVDGSPLVWNKTITRSSAGREEAVTEDRLGLALWNAAGDLVDPLPNLDRYDRVYTIAWTQSAVPAIANIDIDGKTNSGPVTINIQGITATASKSQAKVTNSSVSVTETSEVEGGTNITKRQYNCSITIQIRTPKWVFRCPNRGWKGFISEGSGGGFTEITFRDTKDHDTNQDAPPATAQVDMNEDGTRRADGSNILMLPDDLIDQDTPNSRDYVDDGAFELEDQYDLASIINPLND